MFLQSSELIALAAGASFAAGLNVYAALATLGLLGRTGAVTLPLALHPVESGYVIALSLALFTLEFVADEAPGFVLVWNALHTFIRVPVAALLAYAAATHFSAGAQLTCSLMGGLIALAAHGAKMAVRSAATPSPAPISNLALSLGEDTVAVGLTWLSIRRPLLASALVAFLLIITIVIARWIVSALRALFRGAEQRLARL